MKKSMYILFGLFWLFSFNIIGQETIANIPIKIYEGKWFINLTNFPMWLNSKKNNPTFNYEVFVDSGDTLISDIVRFEKKGKSKSIVGVDKVLNETNTKFRWRGKGFLKLFKSDWEVLYIDSEHQWMIIYFEASLVTPEGYDVVSRVKILDKATLNSIQLKMSKLGITNELQLIHQE